MLVRVMLCVENRQQDQTQSSSDREHDGSNSTSFIKPAFVPSQLTGMPKPTLGYERQIHEDHCYCTTGNEQRFDSFGTNMRDVPVLTLVAVAPLETGDSRDSLPITHGGIMRFSICRPRPKHGNQRG